MLWRERAAAQVVAEAEAIAAGAGVQGGGRGQGHAAEAGGVAGHHQTQALDTSQEAHLVHGRPPDHLIRVGLAAGVFHLIVCKRIPNRRKKGF